LVEKVRRGWPHCEQQQEVDYLWGRCLAAEAKFDEARAAYARVIGAVAQSKTETAAMAQWMIGETYLHQQRYDDAIREYLRVEALYGYPQWQAAALIEAGKCYEALGRRADAAEIYNRIVEKYGQTAFCDEARQRLRSESAPDKAASASPTSSGRKQ
jgi:TolA-binding protein